MKSWQLISKNTLKLYDQPGKAIGADEVKIKISKVLLTKSSALVFDGSAPVPYPFIPGSYAIGRVSESGENCAAYGRNDRVVMRTAAPDGEGRPLIAGIDKTGFLRDFVNARHDEFFTLPPSVSDDEALLLGMLSLAEATIDALHAKKGEFIAVSGGSDFSVILCQLLLYYKIIPILIETGEERISFARQCGVFYAFRNDDALQSNIFEITGGRFCNGAVYANMSNGVSPVSLIDLAVENSAVIFAGPGNKSWNIPSSVIARRQLCLRGVYSGSGFEMSAINSLANKAIDLSHFEKTYTPMDGVPAVFERLSRPESAGNSLLEIVTL